MTETLRTYLDFAIETAWQAGQLTLGYFQTGLRPDFKADESPVTIADREAEKLIRSRIEKQYPGHAIMGEEFGSQENTAGSSHRWLIDPIDGTRSFVRGVPLYGILIGLEIEGQSQVGVAHFPALGEMIAAATGEGCWWNGRRARVSQVEQLSQAVVTHYDAASFDKYNKAAAWERLKKTAGYRAGWADAYGYALVATGRVEVMLDPVMHPWDGGPFPPILAEAGGYFGDWHGCTTVFAGEGLATTQTLLPEVLQILNGE
ncbi:MAG: inositol monophosphatase family protein [Anaerolineales bacterium]|nr:inositol monophosphatase family protein [Anaerolineales bacterium]